MSESGRPVVRLLGPVELRQRGAALPVTAAKSRAVLAMLALAAGRVVSTGELVEGLWGEAPPPTSTNALQVHVGVLRRALRSAGGGSALVTRPPGYSLDADVDVTQCEEHRRRGREATRAGDHEQALGHFSAGGDLWQGPALADLRAEPFAEHAAPALDELQLSLTEARIGAAAHVVPPADLVDELEGLVARHPLREALWAQLALAGYRSGRQGDALRAVQRARRRLDEELGVDLGPELRDLHARLLRQDPSLDLPAARPPVGSAGGRRPAVPVAPSALPWYDASTRLRGGTETAPHLLLPDGTSVPIPATGLLIGRHVSSDLALADEDVSRRHVRAAFRGGILVLDDLGSTNGTHVAGDRVEHAELADGETFRIGSTTLRYVRG